MSLFDRRADDLYRQAEWACNRPVLSAAMAAAALIVCAEGNPAASTRQVVAEALENLDVLKPLHGGTASNLFTSFTNGIRSRPGAGRDAALAAVAAVSGEAASARAVLQACRAVARATGGPSARESAAIAEISAALKVPPPDLDEEALRDGARPEPFVIALGNEKGGTGKSTLAMHLAVALLKLGYRVGSIDLDGRQGTLSRYVSNRETLAAAIGREVPVPAHRRLGPSEAGTRAAAQQDEAARLGAALAELSDRQIVVLDTPGSDCHLSRLGHGAADMLITPINDTLMDVDILAHIDPQRREARAPSDYCKMVWDQNARRVAAGGKPCDWIVLRNRLTHIGAHNKRAIAELLEQLARRIGFRLASGFGERVVFHELFLTGLTVLDLPDDRLRGWNNLSLSHARREIHDLLLALGVPEREIARKPG